MNENQNSLKNKVKGTAKEGKEKKECKNCKEVKMVELSERVARLEKEVIKQGKQDKQTKLMTKVIFYGAVASGFTAIVSLFSMIASWIEKAKK